MSTFADDHRGLRELLGPFALGHLSGSEHDRVRAHLDGCAECRAELEDLLPVARALDAVDARAFTDDPAPLPPTLGEGVRRAVADARRTRDADELGRRRVETLAARRRSRTRLLGAAAALVVAAGVGGAVGRATAPEPPAVPAEAISLQVDEQQVSVESADLVAHTWGVELRIVAAGFAEGETFRAAFRTDDGTLVPAGEFRGVGDDPMTCFLQSATLREDVTQVLVTDAGGRTVLSSDL